MNNVRGGDRKTESHALVRFDFYHKQVYGKGKRRRIVI